MPNTRRLLDCLDWIFRVTLHSRIIMSYSIRAVHECDSHLRIVVLEGVECSLSRQSGQSEHVITLPAVKLKLNKGDLTENGERLQYARWSLGVYILYLGRLGKLIGLSAKTLIRWLWTSAKGDESDFEYLLLFDNHFKVLVVKDSIPTKPLGVAVCLLPNNLRTEAARD